jgi:hypothetical protein
MRLKQVVTNLTQDVARELQALAKQISSVAQRIPRDVDQRLSYLERLAPTYRSVVNPEWDRRHTFALEKRVDELETTLNLLLAHVGLRVKKREEYPQKELVDQERPQPEQKE